jgi:AcrR family transcriptional regulator
MFDTYSLYVERITGMSPTRRDEHVADTRQALVDAARKLFTEQGYAATGTEEIVAAARVTRGALYHHFRDKTDLFRAVMEQIAREVAERLIEAELSRPGGAPGEGDAPGETNAWDEVRDGLSAFLDLCVETDDFQRIVLVEGPAVLGHEAWDDLVAQHGSNLLAEWLSRAIEQGSIAPVPVQPLTRLLIAMISESSLYIARADDRSAARDAMGRVLDRLLDGLEPAEAPQAVAAGEQLGRHARVLIYLLCCRLQRLRIQSLIGYVVREIRADVGHPLLGCEHCLDSGGRSQADRMIGLAEGDAIINGVTDRQALDDKQAGIRRIGQVAVQNRQICRERIHVSGVE